MYDLTFAHQNGCTYTAKKQKMKMLKYIEKGSMMRLHTLDPQGKIRFANLLIDERKANIPSKIRESFLPTCNTTSLQKKSFTPIPISAFDNSRDQD